MSGCLCSAACCSTNVALISASCAVAAVTLRLPEATWCAMCVTWSAPSPLSSISLTSWVKKALAFSGIVASAVSTASVAPAVLFTSVDDTLVPVAAAALLKISSRASMSKAEPSESDEPPEACSSRRRPEVSQSGSWY